MTESYVCSGKCCNYKITPYPNVKWTSDGAKNPLTKIVKAGSFVIDPENTKILLVQSRGHLWGPPKGTIKEGENHEQCAIREVFEETGLKLVQSEFLSETIVKNRAIYFTTEVKEFDVNPQNHIEDNDANGIGWFNVDCLNDLIISGKIKINQHTKILVKKFFAKIIA